MGHFKYFNVLPKDKLTVEKGHNYFLKVFAIAKLTINHK